MEEAQITIEANAQDDEEDFLRKLIKKGVLVLKPSLSKQGVRYADAEEIWKVDLADAKAIIARLAEKGAFKPEFVDRVLTCPKCSSPEVFSKYACPKCGSHNVEFTELIEHKKCGNIGPKDSFAKGSSLICPRCQTELKREMSDYRTIGNFYQCEKCGHRFDKPDVIHICQNCEVISTYQDAKYVRIFAYRVAEEAMKGFQTELPILANVKKTLVNEGFKVQLRVKVTGTSGAQSPFDVLAEKGTARLVIDVSTTGSKNDIIGLLAKKVDVNPTGTVIIDLSGQDEITNLGKVFGITVFKAGDNQDLPEDFKSFLKSSSPREDSGKQARRGGG
jgi:predicted RNA-binding Zn-ribbon protein involved in translation (DUF1610 family)